MYKFFTCLLLFLFCVPAFAGEESCPHHDGHQKQMEERGDHVMGFDHTKTVHRFELNPDGGIIRAEALDENDTTSIENIRKHFVEIASLFSKGDFSKPALIHDRVPPGVSVMSRLKSEITYSTHETENGSEVRIKTQNAEALNAIHDFLRFQIQDHKTGDPLTIQP